MPCTHRRQHGGSYKGCRGSCTSCRRDKHRCHCFAGSAVPRAQVSVGHQQVDDGRTARAPTTACTCCAESTRKLMSLLPSFSKKASSTPRKTHTFAYSRQDDMRPPLTCSLSSLHAFPFNCVARLLHIHGYFHQLLWSCTLNYGFPPCAGNSECCPCGAATASSIRGHQ